jgi:drug/metabolite transporter (DMT)-like permease
MTPSKPMTIRPGVGLAYSLVTVLAWGSLGIILRIVLQQVDAFTVTWIRLLVAAVVLGLLLAHKGRFVEARAIGKGLYALVAGAILGLASNFVFYLGALHYIPPGTNQLIFQLATAFFAIGGLYFFRERFTRLQWLGFVGLLTGLAIFFHNRWQELFLHLGNYSLGVLISLCGCLTWAGFALVQKRLLSYLSSATILFLGYLGSALLLTPLSHPNALLALDSLHAWLLVYCCLNTLIGYGAFTEAIRNWEASRVSAVLSLTPLVTLASAEIFSRLVPEHVQPEGITWLSLVGALIAISGSAMTALGRSAKPLAA